MRNWTSWEWLLFLALAGMMAAWALLLLYAYVFTPLAILLQELWRRPVAFREKTKYVVAIVVALTATVWTAIETEIGAALGFGAVIMMLWVVVLGLLGSLPQPPQRRSAPYEGNDPIRKAVDQNRREVEAILASRTPSPSESPSETWKDMRRDWTRAARELYQAVVPPKCPQCGSRRAWRVILGSRPYLCRCGYHNSFSSTTGSALLEMSAEEMRLANVGSQYVFGKPMDGLLEDLKRAGSTLSPEAREALIDTGRLVEEANGKIARSSS